MVKKDPLLRAYAVQDSSPAAEKIQRQLQLILESPEFQTTDRQREFLQFVVTETVGRK